MIVERLTSAVRELRITRMGREAVRLAALGDQLGSRVAWLRLTREIERRTPQQVERMERAQALFRRRAP